MVYSTLSIITTSDLIGWVPTLPLLVPPSESTTAAAMPGARVHPWEESNGNGKAEQDDEPTGPAHVAQESEEKSAQQEEARATTDQQPQDQHNKLTANGKSNAEVKTDEAEHEEDLDRCSEGAPTEEELLAFHELLTEAFNEVDTENTGMISYHQLSAVLDELVEQEIINPYTQEELEVLANDMDVFMNGSLPLDEFLDVLTRRHAGYDFSDLEVKEAFDTFDAYKQGKFGVAELRAVMQAVCDMEVSSRQANHLICAAAGEANALSIDFEQFKKIIAWRMPVREEEHEA